ncbi:MAG: cytidylate kinase-like family protein [bacterium]
MSIITISRGSYSWGKEVAEKVAKRLGYECIARDDVLSEASEEYDIPEIKLLRAIQTAPSFLDRFTPEKEKYIAHIQAAILRHLCKDNVVYHGLAGHFFVKGVSHVLKVRIIADQEDRVKLVMERDRVSRKEALRYLAKIDNQRRKWSQHLYGIDTTDPSLYDMVLHIRKITVGDAADIIAHTVSFPHFAATPESRRALEDLALAAEVKCSLIHLTPEIRVTARDGMVLLETKITASAEMEMVKELEKAAYDVPGVRGVKVEVLPGILYTD